MQKLFKQLVQEHQPKELECELVEPPLEVPVRRLEQETEQVPEEREDALQSEAEDEVPSPDTCPERVLEKWRPPPAKDPCPLLDQPEPRP